LLLAVLLARPALAQYDRDGRYVPSPMGVPSDPNARAIPLYPGTPGAATGTEPQRAPPPVPQLAPMRGREAEALPPPRIIALSAERCRQGWSRASGLPKRVFEARCARRLED
jgi:hypothetical protein